MPKACLLILLSLGYSANLYSQSELERAALIALYNATDEDNLVFRLESFAELSP